jgi:hypothetical protein
MGFTDGQSLETRVELPEDAGFKTNGVVEIERPLSDARGLWYSGSDSLRPP